MFLAKFFQKTTKDKEQKAFQQVVEQTKINLLNESLDLIEPSVDHVSSPKPTQSFSILLENKLYPSDVPVILSLAEFIATNLIPQSSCHTDNPSNKELCKSNTLIEKGVNENPLDSIITEYAKKIVALNNIEDNCTADDVNDTIDILIEKLNTKKVNLVSSFQNLKVNSLTVKDFISTVNTSLDDIQGYASKSIIALNDRVSKSKISICNLLDPLLQELQNLIYKKCVTSHICTLYNLINKCNQNMARLKYKRLKENLLDIKNILSFLGTLNIDEFFEVIQQKLDTFVDCTKIQITHKFQTTLENLNFGLIKNNNLSDLKHKDTFEQQLICLVTAQDIYMSIRSALHEETDEVYWATKMMAALIVIHFRLLFFAPNNKLSRLDVSNSIALEHLTNVLELYVNFIKSLSFPTEKVIAQLCHLIAAEYSQYMYGLHEQIDNLKGQLSIEITLEAIEKRLSEHLSEFLDSLTVFSKFNIKDIANTLLKPHWFDILCEHDFKRLHTYYVKNEPYLLNKYRIHKRGEAVESDDNILFLSETLKNVIQAIQFFDRRISSMPEHYLQLYVYKVFAPIFQNLYIAFKNAWNKLTSLLTCMEDTGFLIDSIYIGYHYLTVCKYTQKNPHLAETVVEWQKLSDETIKMFKLIIFQHIKTDLQSLHWISSKKLKESCLQCLQDVCTVINADELKSVFLNQLAEAVLSEILQYLQVRLNVIYEDQRQKLIENYSFIIEFWANTLISLPQSKPLNCVQEQLNQLKDVKKLLMMPEEACKPILNQLAELLKLNRHFANSETVEISSKKGFLSIQLLKHAESLISSTQQYLHDKPNQESNGTKLELSSDIIQLQIEKSLKNELQVNSLNAKQCCRILSKRYELFFSDAEL